MVACPIHPTQPAPPDELEELVPFTDEGLGCRRGEQLSPRDLPYTSLLLRLVRKHLRARRER
jgi:hypothetical protein